MKVILLAGGRGSRSSDPLLPKILQELTPGWTLLDHWIELLENQGFKNLELVLGHGERQVRSHLRKTQSTSNLEISFVVDDQLSGTANALMYSKCFGQKSLVLMADTLSFLNYEKILAGINLQETQVAFLAHKNSHMFDSDSVELSKDGSVQGFHKKGEAVNLNNSLALTGGFFLNSEAWIALDKLKEKGDVVHDLFREIPTASVRVLPFVGLSMDCGTPARLSKAKNLYSIWRNKDSVPIVVLDRDGTLVPDLPQGRSPSTKLSIESSDALAIARANELGIPVFMVTNQPAIAKGWVSESDVERVHVELTQELAKFSAWIDEIVFCPHYPVGGFPGELTHLKTECHCRKPKTGLMEYLKTKYHLQGCEIWMIGDSDVDEAFANNCGARFVRVKHGSATGVASGLEGLLGDWNSL